MLFLFRLSKDVSPNPQFSDNIWFINNKPKIRNLKVISKPPLPNYWHIDYINQSSGKNP